LKILALLSLVYGLLMADMPAYYTTEVSDTVNVLPTRDNTKIAYKWLEESQNNSGPIIIAINGGHGKWELKDAHITPSRIGMILAQFNDYRVVSLDMPMDEYQNTNGGNGSEVYRSSKNQIDDIKTVLNTINSTHSLVYILTTSKSTLSGINAASSDIENLQGVILTAISTDLSFFLASAHVKTLWIHHMRDKCYPQGIEAVRAMEQKTAKTTFVEVQNSAKVSGKECSMANYHGFVGRDAQLAQTIDDWIKNKEISKTIE